MTTRTKGLVAFVAETEPRLLEAYLVTTMVDIKDRQVEVTLDFSAVPHPSLNADKTLISRDPAVVAFMRRIHETIGRRYAAVEVALAAQSGEEDAA